MHGACSTAGFDSKVGFTSNTAPFIHGFAGFAALLDPFIQGERVLLNPFIQGERGAGGRLHIAAGVTLDVGVHTGRGNESCAQSAPISLPFLALCHRAARVQARAHCHHQRLWNGACLRAWHYAVHAFHAEPW